MRPEEEIGLKCSHSLSTMPVVYLQTFFMSYDHTQVEKKWQKRWVEKKLFKMKPGGKKKKYYILDMFPYPSGAGLHVGHPEGYTATDIISRAMRMQGFNVLHPVGWDAFGLPAENYAIKTKIHPDKSTRDNITTFTRQIQELGFSYDWDREIATCDPSYYRWTQWFFAFLYEKGLAYKKKAPVNWCEGCHTVLANEQVIDGKCDRSKDPVVQKDLEQWFFKITEYVEDRGQTSGLINGLAKIDWPESTKQGQLNWIGKKQGMNITYRVKDSNETITCFTTRPDTNFGATFIVLAPEHPFAKLVAKKNKEVAEYAQRSIQKTERERQEEGKKKTGAFTGYLAINNLNGALMPIWVSDFVLAGFGTGAVVGVPGHDKRDFEFAKAFDLPVIRVVVAGDGDQSAIEKIEQVQEEEGTMINSGFLDGLEIHAATKKVMDYLEEHGHGNRVINYKLRDWLVSRQRYWGAPIPIVYDDQSKHYLVPDDELPVELPTDVDFMPTGESPLTKSKSFHDKKALLRIEKKLKKSGILESERTLVRRESDTMDTFVDSSWYQFRFMDPKNKKEFAKKEIMNSLGPVDLYVGGAEHTVLHLLYARFFTKALHEYGYISYDEPFAKLRHQGIILGEDGEKMSKSRGNVINPDEIVAKFGADTLRIYEMFMGPFADMKPWSTKSVAGVYRFLQKVWRLATLPLPAKEGGRGEGLGGQTLKLTHQTLKKVTHDIAEFKFNTAVAQMMIFANHLQTLKELPAQALSTLLICLSPFAPHMTEEIWEKMGHKKMIMQEKWPAFDAELAKESTITLPIQVNGKLRGSIEVDIDIGQQEALEQAKKEPNVAKFLEGKKIVKEIFIPGRIVNIVVQ